MKNEFDFFPVLRNGRKHPYVSLAKNLMRRRGYWDGTSSEDFGPKMLAAVKYYQTTHLDRNARPLVSDGEIGPETWWTLHHEAREPYPRPPAPPNPAAAATPRKAADFDTRFGMLSSERQKFLALAFGELAANVQEVPLGSNKGDGVDKYIKGFGPAPWCALFVSWLFRETTGRWPGNKQHAHVQTGWRDAASRARTFPKNGSKKPMPGDLAVWHFARGTGHVAVVVAVSPDGNMISTIGGNESDRVRLATRDLRREPSLVGFLDLFSDGRKGEKDFPRKLVTGGLASGSTTSSGTR